MRHVETIIIGGGPAGSTCARHLVEQGRDVLVLDKARFPRLKLCAGWITAKVMRDLDLVGRGYPHPLLPLSIRTHLPLVPFGLPWFPTPGKNYSIRRVEFDAWLLAQSGAEVMTHEVKSIGRDGARFVIDDILSCDHLVGAGGTLCPVRRAFFADERVKRRQIVTLEKEFEYPARGNTCHLYFFLRGLAGYAWYVPKGNGFVNIGIGGKAHYFRALNGAKAGDKNSSDKSAGERNRKPANIHDHFRAFLSDLVREGRLDAATAAELHGTGHPYYLLTRNGAVKRDNCYVIGDAAGLATVDLGEGIGPAVESGLMAAQEIIGTGTYRKESITAFSLSGLAKQLARSGSRRHVFE